MFETEWRKRQISVHFDNENLGDYLNINMLMNN
jgi:hypothetical protein